MIGNSSDIQTSLTTYPVSAGATSLNRVTTSETDLTPVADEVSLSDGKSQETKDDRRISLFKHWYDRVDIDEKPSDPMGAAGVLTEIAGVGLSTWAEGVEIGGSLMQEIGAATGVAAACTGVGIAAAGTYFAITGAKGMKEAIEKKDLKKGVESSADLLLAGDVAIRTGARIAQSSILGNQLGPIAAAIFRSPVMKFLGAGMGVGLGVVETALGGKEIYDGVKAKDKKKILSGAISTGMGIAIGAIALGAGLPAGLALAGLFITDVFMKRKKYKEALKGLAQDASKAVDKVERSFSRAFSKKPETEAVKKQE